MKINETTVAEILMQSPEFQQIENLMNEGAAAALLNCSVAFLRRCRLFATGPAYIKIGRLVRYSSQDLMMYIQTNTKRVAV